MLDGKLLYKICHGYCLLMAIQKNASIAIKILLLMPFLSFVFSASAAQLIVEDAWVKLAPPGVTSHAAYLRLINNNKQALTITHISAAGYAQVLLHQTKIVKDKVQMDLVETLEIPAGTSVEFSPGATHLMLIKPQQQQQINDQVSVTLMFNDGTRQQFMASVQANNE